MRVMVVGGAGFLGSHLVERLLASGHGVDVVDDLSTGSLAHLADARSLGGDLTIHTLDVCAAEFAGLVERRAPGAIFHLAWDHHIIDATAAGRALHSTLAVLEAADRGQTKVIVPVPAVALYGEVPARDQPVKEGQPWAPIGVRGVVAQAVCGLLATYREEHAVEYTALAMANVYGSRQPAQAGAVAAFLDAAAMGIAPVIDGDGRQTRDFLFVDDAVDALARTVDRGDGLLINIGTGRATSVRDLWAMIDPDGDLPTRPDSSRDGGVGRFALAPTRARIHLAWEAWTDLPTGLAALR